MGSRGKNPLFSDTYTADPAVLVHDCTFYITCGHDEGDTGFVLKEWYLLSSTDMVHWEKKVALDLSTFSWADNNAWAGQMVAKDGKFYWFVPVNQRGSGMAIGVAVGDSPLGPFKDAIGKALIDDAFEMSNAGFRTPSDTPFTIDPTVFIDDDGQAYLHYGGFGRMMVAKLASDMRSIDGKLQELTPRGFFEAPYLFKRDGKYYEVYAAGQNPASIDYATSSSPLGPWEYKGRILDPLPGVPGQDAPTSHPAVAELAGQWYLVYHLSNGPNNGGTYRREVAVDKLTWNADGTIKPVARTDGLTF
jgi:beta-xylosidase